MAVNREIIQIDISGLSRIDALEAKLSAISAAANDVVDGINEIDNRIRSIRQPRIEREERLRGLLAQRREIRDAARDPRTTADLGNAASGVIAQLRKKEALLKKDIQTEVGRLRADQGASREVRDLQSQRVTLERGYLRIRSVNQKQIEDKIVAEKKALDEHIGEIRNDTRARRRDSFMRTTRARVSRLEMTARRVGSGAGLDPESKRQQQATKTKIDSILGEFNALVKRSSDLGKFGARLGMDPRSISSQQSAIEGTMRTLATELRSTVEQLREPGRLVSGRRKIARRAQGFGLALQELETVQGVSPSRLMASIGDSKKFPLAKILEKAVGAANLAGDIQGAERLVNIVRDRIKAITDEINYGKKLNKQKNDQLKEENRLTTASADLGKQKIKSEERLAGIQQKILSGRQVTAVEAADLRFSQGMSGRQPLALPPARGFAADRPLPREALLPTGGARMVGQSREFLVGPTGRRTNIPELERLGIKSMLPLTTPVRSGRSASAGITEPALFSVGGKNIFDIFKNFGKALPEIIAKSSKNAEAERKRQISGAFPSMPISGSSQTIGSPEFMRARQSTLAGVRIAGTKLSELSATGAVSPETISSFRSNLIELAKAANTGARPVETLKQELDSLKTGISSLSTNVGLSRRGIDVQLERILGAGTVAGSLGGGRTPQQAFEAISKLPGVNLARPAQMSAANIEKVNAALTEIRQGLDLTDAELKQFANTLSENEARLGRELERRDPSADFLTRSLGPRGGRALSEGLIGGAFPLLFGQGPGASLGGLVGGAAGGFAGGMLGFGASLIGTALGQAADDLRQATADTGNALRDLTGNFAAIKEMALVSSRGQERVIESLLESGRVATAYALIQDDVNSKLGASGVAALIRSGDAADRMTRAMAELGKQMEVFVAGPLASALEAITRVIEERNLQSRLDRAVEQAPPGVKEKILPGLAARAPQGAISSKKSIFGNIFSALMLPATGVESLFGVTPKLDAALLGRKEAERAIRGLAGGGQAQQLTPFQAGQQGLRVAQQRLGGLQEESKLKSSITEAKDAARGFRQQIISAAREQQDIDRQGAEIRRNYEQQIAEIRKGVEEKVSQLSQENSRRELEILNAQGQIREQQFRNAAAVLQNELAGDPLAQQLASAVDAYFAAQSSAQDQLQQQQKQFQAEMASVDVEIEKYKIEVAKNVSKLNVDTARQIEQINLGIIRKNEDARLNDFKSQKETAINKLKVLQQEIEVMRAQNELNRLDVALRISESGATPVLTIIKQVFDQVKASLEAGIREVPGNINEIARINAPRALTGVAPVDLKSVSTAGVDRQFQRARALESQIQGLREVFTSLVKDGNIIQLREQLEKIAFAEPRAAIQEMNEALRDSRSALGDTSIAIDVVNKSYDELFARLREEKGLSREQIDTAIKALTGYRDMQTTFEDLRSTITFYTKTQNDLTQENQRLADSVREMLGPVKEFDKYSRIFAKSGGLEIDTEQRKSILEAAKNVDTLNQKLSMLGRIDEAARGWTDAFIGFNKELLTTGNLVESVRNWTEDIAGKSIDIILEATLRPMQEEIFKNVAKFLGFEMPQDPTLRPLNDISGFVKSSADSAAQILDQLRAKSGPVIKAPLEAPMPRTQAAIAGVIGNMLPGTKGGPNINEGVGYGRGRLHAGRDLGIDIGDPINARMGGRVTQAYPSGFGRVGGAVVVKYENGMEGTYGHVTPGVKPGQTVSAGEKIATIAPDGQNTHLHYELRDQVGRILEPLKFIQESLRVAPGTRLPNSATTAASAVQQLEVIPYREEAAAAANNIVRLSTASEKASSSLEKLQASVGTFSLQRDGDRTPLTTGAWDTANADVLNTFAKAGEMGDLMGRVNKKEEDRIAMLDRFGKALGEGIKMIGSAAMVVGGIEAIGKGGTYNTLIGLSSIFGGLAGATGTAFGWFGGRKMPGFANGGRPRLDGPSVIGERGPEIWWPDQAGTVIPFKNIYAPGMSSSPSASSNASTDNGEEDPAFAATRRAVERQQMAASASAADSEIASLFAGSQDVRVGTYSLGKIDIVTTEQLEAALRQNKKETEKTASARTLQQIKNNASLRKRLGI